MKWLNHTCLKKMGKWYLVVFFAYFNVWLLRNHLNLPLYNESSFWRGARSYQPSPVGHDRCSHDRLIGIKHSLQGSTRDLNYPVQNNNNAEPRKLSRQMAQTLYEIDSKPLNYSAQCQGSYSSSDTDSQDQSRIPKYNSQILGTSTRSLIQQVSKKTSFAHVPVRLSPWSSIPRLNSEIFHPENH